MKLTEKDKRLLIFLGFFLIIAGLGFGVILPLYGQNQKLRESYREAQWKYQESIQKMYSVSFLEEETAARKEELQEKGADFFEPMTVAGIDRQITDVLLRYGVTVESLQITMPKADVFMNLAPYIKSEGATAEKEPSEETEETDEFFGLQTAEAVMYLNGSQEALESVIWHFTGNLPKMRVTEIEWRNVGEENCSLHIRMELYMQHMGKADSSESIGE